MPPIKNPGSRSASAGSSMLKPKPNWPWWVKRGQGLPPSATPFFRAASSADSGGSNVASQNLTIPSGAVVGDLALFVATCPTGISMATPTGLTLVASWTDSYQTAGTSGPNVQCYLFKKTIGVSDPGSTVTFTPGSSTVVVAGCSVYGNCSGIGVGPALGKTLVPASNGTSPRIPEIYQGVNDLVVILGAAQSQSDTTVANQFMASVPYPFTKRVDDAQKSGTVTTPLSVWIADGTAGVLQTLTPANNISSYNCSAALALSPLGVTPTDQPPSALQGAALHVYSESLNAWVNVTTQPPYTFFSVSPIADRIAQELGSTDYENFAMPGAFANDIAGFAYGTVSYATRSISTNTGWSISRAGTWLSQTHQSGLVYIEALGNDAIHDQDASPSTPAKSQAGFQNSIDALVRLIRAASFVGPTDSSIVYSGFSAGSTINDAANDAEWFSTTANSTITITVTQDSIDLVFLGIDNAGLQAVGGAGLSGANFKITVDGSPWSITGHPYSTGTNTGTTGDQIKQSSSAYYNKSYYGPMAVPIHGMGAGSHTIVITHNGGPNTTNYLLFNGYIIPSSTPPYIVLAKLAHYNFTQLSAATGLTNTAAIFDTYSGIVETVAGLFDSKVMVWDPLATPGSIGTPWDYTTMVNTQDYIHPLDKGTGWIAHGILQLLQASIASGQTLTFSGTATQTQSVTVTRQVLRASAATQSQTSTQTLKPNRAANVTQSQAGSSAKSMTRGTLNATQSQTPTVIAALSRVLPAATQGQTATLAFVRHRFIALSATQAQTGLLSRALTEPLLASQGQSSTVTTPLSRVLPAVSQSQTSTQSVVVQRTLLIGGGIDPSTIAGRVFDIDASTIAGHVDGDSLASWTDLSGTTTLSQATGSRQPIYHTNVLSGNPGVRFNLSNTQGFAVSGASPFGVTNGYALFWVLEQVVDHGSYGNVLANASSSGAWMHSSQVSLYMGGDHPTSLMSTGTPAVVAITVDTSGNMASFVNGVADATYTGLASSWTPNGLGTDAGGAGEAYDGWIFRLVAFDVALTPAQVVGITNFLMNQWGLGGAGAGQGQAAAVSPRALARSLSTTQGQSPTSSRQLTRAISASQSQATPTETRALSRILPASQSQTDTLVATKVRLIGLAPTQGQSPSVVQSLVRPFSTTQGQSTSTVETVARSSTTSQGQTANSVRSLSRQMVTTQTQTSTLGPRALKRTLTGSQSQIGVDSRGLTRSLSVTPQSQSASVVEMLSRLLVSSQGQATSAVDALRRVLAAMQSQTPSQSHITAIPLTLSTTQSQTDVLARAVARGQAATQTQSGSMIGAAGRSLTASQGQSSSTATSVLKVVLATQSQTPSIARRLARTVVLIQPQSTTFTEFLMRTLNLTQAQSSSSVRTGEIAYTLTQGRSTSLSVAGTRVLVASQAQVSVSGSALSRSLSSTQGQVCVLSPTAGHFITMSVSQPQTPTEVLQTSRSLAGTQGQSASSALGFSRQLSASQSSAGTIDLGLLKVLGATQAQSMTVVPVKNSGALSATQPQTSAFVRRVGRYIILTQTQNPLAGLPPPHICFPAMATLTSYGSVASISGYNTQASVNPYSSTSTILSYMSTSTISSYASQTSVVPYGGSHATTTPYSSTADIRNYYSSATVGTCA